MLMAARNGRFEIVKFLNEKCGEEFSERMKRRAKKKGEDEEDEVFRIDCPLASAVNVGQLDTAKYLYTNHCYRPSYLKVVLTRLASKVSLELVELFYDDGRYDLPLTGTAFEFAAGSGQVEVMKFFHSKEELFYASFLDDAFLMAASFGKLESVKYFLSTSLNLRVLR
ncbi:hypothetical protein PI124_g19256 [Phytophthora idaei]|nr:hypothetical protein PI126_g15511 [Phytophthora idaei]KAG3235711.1 hypothetical protein PI124_g19256 [Phytophthora idaei]